MHLPPAHSSAPRPAPGLTNWPARYQQVRARTQALCAALSTEDMVLQPIADVSPAKWHLGHTSWFFEAMVLQVHQPGYVPCHPAYGHVFNSYYETLGERVQRSQRGQLSRPTVAEVLAYRQHVDHAMLKLLDAGPGLSSALAELVELGLQHEQQHQELLATDVLYSLGTQALAPAFSAQQLGALDLPTALQPEAHTTGGPDRWLSWAGGPCQVGHAGSGFAFDNELPRHTVWVPPTQLRASLVRNHEYLDFMADGGYQRFEFWHAEAWDWLAANPALRQPLHWRADLKAPGQWQHYSLRGWQALAPHAPVCHVSYYEAYAFCQWAGWRLPTEFEWEALSPQLAWGQRWEWTESAYLPYPGFQRVPGSVGEYNGKFMVNQKVLRGASVATPPGHARASYRNFFHPPARWQYTGIRPARDLPPDPQSPQQP